MDTIIDLVNEYSGQIPYFKLLMSKEWYDRRKDIIKRDNDTCQKCGRSAPDDWVPRYIQKNGFSGIVTVPVNYDFIEIETEKYIPEIEDTITMSGMKKITVIVEYPILLHVHHKYYILSKYPWEYPDDALITLCVDCHENTHEAELIPVYLDGFEETCRYLTPCHRCNAQGVLEQYWYVAQGICFKCGGVKYEELIAPKDKINSDNFSK